MEDLISLLILIGPTAFIIFILRTKMVWWKVLLYAAALLPAMIIFGDILAQDPKWTPPNAPPSQKGGAVLMVCGFSAIMAECVAVLGLIVRHARDVSDSLKIVPAAAGPVEAEAGAVSGSNSAGPLPLKPVETVSSGYKLHPAVVAQARATFPAPDFDRVLEKLKTTILPVERAGPAPRIHLAVIWLSKGDIAAFDARLAEAQADPNVPLAAAGLSREDWRSVAAKHGVDCAQW